MDTKVNGFARALQEIGVKKGARVSLVLPNSPTYVIAFYAVMKLGAIVVNINVMSHGDELASFINDSESRVVITLDIFVQNVLGIVKKTCLEEIVIHSVFGLEKKLEIEEGVPEIKIFGDLVEAASPRVDRDGPLKVHAAVSSKRTRAQGAALPHPPGADGGRSHCG